MIKRIWHGWTTAENAESYKQLLLSEILPHIASKTSDGYQGFELLQRTDQQSSKEVEFITILFFDDWDAIQELAGDDHTRAYVPEAARQLLTRWDDHAQHYEQITSGK